MEKDLRKRLEEAALKISCICPPHGQFGTGDYEPAEFDEDAYNAALKGAELGYKEAIKVAKEWMRNYFPDELDGKGFEFVSRDEILADFEADMTKLWEE